MNCIKLKLEKKCYYCKTYPNSKSIALDCLIAFLKRNIDGEEETVNYIKNLFIHYQCIDEDEYNYYLTKAVELYYPQHLKIINSINLLK